jgi:DNA-binding protein HU-beta
MALNKNSLADAVEKVLGGSHAESVRAVDAMFDAITKALSQGEDVKVAGFGIFRKKIRKPREARNPKTGEMVHVPEKKVVVFKPGLILKHQVK